MVRQEFLRGRNLVTFQSSILSPPASMKTEPEPCLSLQLQTHKPRLRVSGFGFRVWGLGLRVVEL